MGAVFARRAPGRMLVRMWVATPVLNFGGLAGLGAIVAVKGVLPPGSLHAVGVIANTLSDRSFIAALMSAILAGLIMTVFTWIFGAVQTGVPEPRSRQSGGGC